MGFQPGHGFVLQYAPETTPITESPDGVTPAIIPANPLNPVLVGFVNPSDIVEDEGTKKGYGGGAPQSLYDSLGQRIYQLTADIRIGSIAFIQKCLLGSGGTFDLADLALYYGQSNRYGDGETNVIRYAKCNQLALSFQEAAGNELTANAMFEGIAQRPGALITPTLTQLQAIGPTLFWQNVMQCLIQGINYRNGAIASISASVAHNIERKASRPDWGEHEPASRTSFGLLPHTNVVTGEFTLHKALPNTLFNSAVGATRWGDVVIQCSDATALPDGQTPKIFNVTFTNVRPVRRQQRGGDVNAQITRSVPFVADDLLVATA